MKNWNVKIHITSEENRSEFFKGSAYHDFALLNELSTDAAPVVLEWAEDIHGYRYEEHIAERVGEITLRNLNVSRAEADLLLVRMNKRG